MRVLDDLCDVLEMELKDIVKKDDLSPTELDSAYKAVDIIKDIKTIEAMGEYSYDDGYSTRQYSNNRYMYDSYPNDYANDYSRSRRGRDGDGDGRYSERRGGRGRGEYSNDEKEHLMSKIDEMKRQLEQLN